MKFVRQLRSLTYAFFTPNASLFSNASPMPPHFPTARFISGAHTLAQAPPDTGREIAFAGRSNAGKSSAINALTGIQSLARVSKTPGRTQQLNFFELGPERRLVDLPGYGYAKAPEQSRRHWKHTLEQYLASRQSLCGLVLIMDIRHPMTPADLEWLDACFEGGLPVCILLSKADKLSRSAMHLALRHVTADLTQRYPGYDKQGVESQPLFEVQAFSVLKKVGIDEAKQRLASWLDL